ncbi:hypothetical protein VTJ04DRAFT_385 [Mycothermus thermophilus]|uniref:uncharacterized protein n=1 Tax=Humicola insolens TaxID=85995 RepID=UPI00374270DE
MHDRDTLGNVMWRERCEEARAFDVSVWMDGSGLSTLPSRSGENGRWNAEGWICTGVILVFLVLGHSVKGWMDGWTDWTDGWMDGWGCPSARVFYFEDFTSLFVFSCYFFIIQILLTTTILGEEEEEHG